MALEDLLTGKIPIVMTGLAPQSQPGMGAPQGPVREISQIDPNLINAIVHQESGGNPTAKGRQGEIGLMQIMPSTARQYGVTDPEKLFDPVVNRDVGTRFFADMLKRFKGDTFKALLAYNAGPGRVASGKIPKSSFEYARNILARAKGGSVSRVMGGETPGPAEAPAIPLMARGAALPSEARLTPGPGPMAELPSAAPSANVPAEIAGMGMPLMEPAPAGPASAPPMAAPPPPRPLANVISALSPAPAAAQELPPGYSLPGGPAPATAPSIAPPRGTPTPMATPSTMMPPAAPAPAPSAAAGLEALPKGEAFNAALLQDPNQRAEYLSGKFGEDNVTVTPGGSVLLKQGNKWIDTSSSMFRSWPEAAAGGINYGLPFVGQVSGAALGGMGGAAVGGPFGEFTGSTAGAGAGAGAADVAINQIRKARGLPPLPEGQIPSDIALSAAFEAPGRALMLKGPLAQAGRYAEERPMLEPLQNLARASETELTPRAFRKAVMDARESVALDKLDAELTHSFGNIVGMSPEEAGQRMAQGGISPVSKTYQLARMAKQKELDTAYNALFDPIKAQVLKGFDKDAHTFAVGEVRKLAARPQELEKQVAKRLLIKAGTLPPNADIKTLRGLYLDTNAALRSLPRTPANDIPRGSLNRLRGFLEQQQEKALTQFGQPGDLQTLHSLNRAYGAFKENLPFIPKAQTPAFIDKLYNPKNDSQLSQLIDAARKTPNPDASLASLRRGFVMKLFRDAKGDPAKLASGFAAYPDWFRQELFKGVPGKLDQVKNWSNFVMQLKSTNAAMRSDGWHRSILEYMRHHAARRMMVEGALVGVGGLIGSRTGGVQSAAEIMLGMGAFLATAEGVNWVLHRPALMNGYLNYITAPKNAAAKTTALLKFIQSLGAAGLATYAKQPEPEAQPLSTPAPASTSAPASDLPPGYTRP